jgi:hypothetical protein
MRLALHPQMKFPNNRIDHTRAGDTIKNPLEFMSYKKYLAVHYLPPPPYSIKETIPPHKCYNKYPYQPSKPIFNRNPTKNEPKGAPIQENESHHSLKMR